MIIRIKDYKGLYMKHNNTNRTNYLHAEILVIESINYISNSIINNKLYLNDFVNNKKYIEFIKNISTLYSMINILNLPKQEEEQIFYILYISSIAYCSNNISDIQYLYDKNNHFISLLKYNDNISWDKRLLYSIFECWIIIFKNINKNINKDDIKNILDITTKLRKEQKIYEIPTLNSYTGYEQKKYCI